MVKQTKNISTRQALIIFILMIGAPSIQSGAIATIEKAKQAAWLCPMFGIIVLFIYFLIMQNIFSKYDKESFVAIMENIIGSMVGKALGIVFFLYLSLIASSSLRVFGERLTAALSISTSYIVYVGVLIVFLSYVLKYDIVVLARLCEILLWVEILSFMTPNILVLPNVKILNLYPVTHMDIVPVMQGSVPLISIWAVISFVFMFSDKISNKKKLFKLGVKAIVLLIFLTFFTIAIPLGVFGNSAKSLVYPYLSSTQTISLFDAVERIDVLVVATWIISDFVLIALFALAGLHTLKSTFRLSDIKPFINIYIIMLFFLSIYIANNRYELEILTARVITGLNIIIGFGIPFILFLIGKIRKII